MYTKEESVYIWLDLFDFLSHKKKTELLGLFKDSVDFWDNFEKNSRVKEIAGAEYNKLVYSHNNEFLNMQLKGLERINVTAVTTVSKAYPEKLRPVHEPPFVLYCRGDVTLLNSRAVAIVGSRRCTRYGLEQGERFSRVLCEHGLAVISGLAEGIDTSAHNGALKAGGKTIAVLAGGLNEIYPAINLNLSKEIAEKGLLVSEMRPNYRAEKFSFPVRNRIIAALSEGVFVPEMGEPSGARHTLMYANDLGLEMFVLPGPVTSSASKGSNNLIKNCQGACVTEPEDILIRLGFDPKASEVKQAKLQLTIDEQIIYSSLKNEEIHYNELLEKTKLPAKTLNSLLTNLEIRGLIKKLPGNFYSH